MKVITKSVIIENEEFALIKDFDAQTAILKAFEC